MPNLASNKVTVFPNAQRAVVTDYLKARKMTEENITGIIRHITDTSNDGYVISDDYSISSTELEFVIHGYYFRIDTGSESADPLAGFRPCYAHIETTTTSEGYTELVGQDDGSSYKGLLIDTNQSATPSVEGNTIYTLQLLDSEGKIPASSRIKFLPDTIDITKISYIGGITVN